MRVALATRNEDRAESYRLALQIAGIEAVTFAPDGGESLDSVQGLVLTGGTDVDPALYSAALGPETDTPDRQRDGYEIDLLRSALIRDIPVLGICRGQQLFNVARGGTLIQHLPNTARHQQKSGGAPVHRVIAEGSMAELFGARDVAVNSRHHQAVDRPGDGIVVTARDSEDDVIEGFVFPRARFAVAVQWHPEDMIQDPVQARLFTAFASAMM